MLRGLGLAAMQWHTYIYGFSYRNLAMKLENVSWTLGLLDTILINDPSSRQRADHCLTNYGEIKGTERYLRTLTNVVMTDKEGKRRGKHLLSDNILMTMTKLKLLGKSLRLSTATRHVGDS